jgi:hypothetical protein
MTNIAMENPNHKWRFLAGNIIYKWAIYTMAMLNNQMVAIGDIQGKWLFFQSDEWRAWRMVLFFVC